jgi:hypothetical protein
MKNKTQSQLSDTIHITNNKTTTRPLTEEIDTQITSPLHDNTYVK